MNHIMYLTDPYHSCHLFFFWNWTFKPDFVGKCGCQVSASRIPRDVPGTCLPAKSTLDLPRASENAMENQRKQRLAAGYLPFGSFWNVGTADMKETRSEWFLLELMKSHWMSNEINICYIMIVQTVWKKNTFLSRTYVTFSTLQKLRFSGLERCSFEA